MRLFASGHTFARCPLKLDRIFLPSLQKRELLLDRQRRNLEDFAGTDASGTWTLTITDNAARDTGTLDHWAIVIQP